MPSFLTSGSNARASISEVGLMRKIHGLPDVVILPEEDVSTSIGTPYSSSLGITASVSVELQAPSITGTLSFCDQLLGGRDRLGRVGLVVLDDELDLAAEHAAGLVDLVLGDLGALRDVVAGRRERAGQRLRDADLDRCPGACAVLRAPVRERCDSQRNAMTVPCSNSLTVFGLA